LRQAGEIQHGPLLRPLRQRFARKAAARVLLPAADDVTPQQIGQGAEIGIRLQVFLGGGDTPCLLQGGFDFLQQGVDAPLQALVLMHQRIPDQHPGHAPVFLGEAQQEAEDQLELADAGAFLGSDLVDDAEQALLDAEGLLQQLRDNPSPHAQAVERFFDAAAQPGSVPLPAAVTEGLAKRIDTAAQQTQASSLLDMLQAQSARLATMEAELETARRTLNERKVIERAKGVLMSRMGLTEEAAFRALQKTSMDQNRRLLDVAEATLSLPDFAFPRPGSGS